MACIMTHAEVGVTVGGFGGGTGLIPFQRSTQEKNGTFLSNVNKVTESAKANSLAFAYGCTSTFSWLANDSFEIGIMLLRMNFGSQNLVLHDHGATDEAEAVKDLLNIQKGPLSVIALQAAVYLTDWFAIRIGAGPSWNTMYLVDKNNCNDVTIGASNEGIANNIALFNTKFAVFGWLRFEFLPAEDIMFCWFVGANVDWKGTPDQFAIKDSGAHQTCKLYNSFWVTGFELCVILK